MQKQLTKRALFRGRFAQSEAIRPPGAAQDFIAKCDQCGDCLAACPTDIILTDNAGFPSVDLTKGSCLFCNDCADACEAGAIERAAGWNLRAKVKSSCLSFNGVTCRACEDHCDQQAIRFHLLSGGRSVPVFDLESCTGCAACAAPCPTQSIDFFEHQQPCEETQC